MCVKTVLSDPALVCAHRLRLITELGGSGASAIASGAVQTALWMRWAPAGECTRAGMAGGPRRPHWADEKPAKQYLHTDRCSAPAW